MPLAEEAIVQKIAKPIDIKQTTEKPKPSSFDRKIINRPTKPTPSTQTRQLIKYRLLPRKLKANELVMDTPNDLGEDPLLLEDIDVEKPQQLQPIINDGVVIEMPVVEDELDDNLESIEDESSFAVESLEDANMPIDTLETLGQDIGNLELIDSDTVPANETIPEDDTFQDFKKLLDVYLESYDQKQVEDIKGTVETIEAAIDECNQLTEQTSDEEKILVVQNLRQLCLELFNSLDIECDEKTIYQFLESIILKDSVIHATLANEMSIKELNYLGTREYKPSDDVISLIGLKQQDSKPYLALGQYMLRICLV